MERIGLNLKEKLILSISAILLIVSVIYLAGYDKYQSQTKKKQIPFGKVQEKFKNLKRKNIDSMVWEDIGKDKEIYLGDKIFTSENSNATLKIGGNSFIEMSPLTLIQLKQNQTMEPQVELQDGSLKASISNNEIKSIQTGTTELSLGHEGADLLVDNQNLGGSVVVLSGAVLLTAGDKKQEIKKNEAVHFSDNKFGALEIIDHLALTPSVKSVIPLSQTKEIPFSWKTLNLKKESRVIEIASEPNFKDLLEKKYTDKFNEKINLSNLKPGTYYWRIKYISDKKEHFTPQKFTIFNDSPPRPLYPTQNQNLYLPNENGLSFKFLWEDVAAQSYRIETNALEVDEKSKALEMPLTKNEYLMTIRNKGQFWWRVQAIFDGHTGPWSEKIYFEVKDESLPLNAIYKLPQNQSILKAEGQTITFKWTGTPKKEYKITISKDENFKEIIEEALSSSGEHSWAFERSGEIFWKVSSTQQVSKPETWKFQIETPVIFLTAPENQARLTFIEKGNKIEFRWNIENEQDPNGTRTKLIIINKENQEIHRAKTQKNFYEWTPKEAGKYNWRVEFLDSKSSINEFEITFPAPLKAPKIQKEIRSKIKRKKAATEILYDMRDRHIALVNSLDLEPSSEVVSFAEIKWDKISDAKEYNLEIYQDSVGKNLIITRKLNNNFYNWLNVPPGIYYFRVSYSDEKGRKSPFSDFSRLIVEDIKDTDRFIEIVYPKNKYITTGERFGFEWKSHSQAQKYIIIIKDFKSKKTYKRLESKSNSIMTPLKNGLYRWQVIGIENDVEIAMSDERFLKITSDQEMKQKKNTFISKHVRNSIEADFILGNTNSKSTGNESSTSFEDQQNLQLFPSSFKISALLKTTNETFVMTSLDYKNSSSNDVNFLSDVYATASLNWTKKMTDTVSFFYGPNLGYNSISVVNDDSIKNMGSSLNYLIFAAKAGLNVQTHYSTNHQLMIDGGLSFITVNSKTYSLSYNIRKSRILFLKNWKNIYQNLFVHTGIAYHHKEASDANYKLKLSTVEIPIGLGFYID